MQLVLQQNELNSAIVRFTTIKPVLQQIRLTGLNVHGW